MKTIRIGNGAGFAGDNLDAPRHLAETGQLDYLTLEYLAELTMSILAHQKAGREDAGFVSDFLPVMESLTDCLHQQPGLRIVTNAGGMNPQSCARKVAEVLAAANLDDMLLAAVSGDDLLGDFESLRASGESFQNLDTGAPLDEISSRIVSANAYLGSAGIVDALQSGARVVMTGRVADASLAVGPAIHEFGWAWDDWGQLAAATVAGHLIECGAQVSGGMYSDWNDALPLSDVGYPIVAMGDDGSCVVTKPENTGGCVTTGTVSEQLVYEIGDPANYLTPDVVADFSQVRLEQCGQDRVAVSGASGQSAPDRYKVSLAYEDGYTASGTLVISGRNAEDKSRRSAEMIFDRVRRAGFEFERRHVECLGSGDSLPGVWTRAESSPEVVLRVSVQHSSREAVERWTREFAPLVTSGPPGVTGYTAARAKPRRVLAYWPTTISRELVSAEAIVKTAKEWLA